MIKQAEAECQKNGSHNNGSNNDWKRDGELYIADKNAAEIEQTMNDKGTQNGIRTNRDQAKNDTEDHRIEKPKRLSMNQAEKDGGNQNAHPFWKCSIEAAKHQSAEGELLGEGSEQSLGDQ